MAKKSKETRVVRKKKGGFLGKLLCFLLGLIIGIAGAVGAVVGVGLYIYDQPVEKTVNLIDKYVPADVYGVLFGKDGKEGYLNEKYASLKVKDLLDDTLDAVEDLSDKTGTLSDLNEISPKISTLVEKLLKKTDEYAIPLDYTTLMGKSIKDIPGYLGDSIKATPIGDLFEGMDKTPTPLMMAISYGEEGIDYTFDANQKVVMLGDSQKTLVNDLLKEGGMDAIIDKLTLDSVMTVDTNDTVMCAIAYGSSNRYTVKDNKAYMNQVAYTVEVDSEKNVKLYDDRDELVNATVKYISNSLAVATLANGEVQYVSYNSDGAGLAYSSQMLNSPVLYKKTKIADLTEDSMSVINNIYLKDALEVNAHSHKVLISLAYGEEDKDFYYEGEGENREIKMKGNANPRTIGELRLRNEDLINDIPLSDIMTPDEDEPIVMYLLYGRENVHYSSNGNGKIEMLQRQIALIGDVVYNEYGEKLDGHTVNTATSVYTDSDGNTYKYVASTLPAIETKDGDATVYLLTDMNGVEVKYTKTTLGDMTGGNNIVSSLTERIKIKEVVDEETINGNKFLKHVKEETIDSLPTAIEELTLQQVYATEIFKTDANDNFLDKNGNVTTNKDEYVVEHEWWYLLHNKDVCTAEHGASCDKECIQDYKITEMDTLIDNMRTNIEAATLNQLKQDGMINELDDTALDKTIKKEIAGISFETQFNEVFTDPETRAKTKLGQFTVVEMLQYVNIIVSLI